MVDALTFTSSAAQQRRDDYDAAESNMPITMALRAMRQPTSPTSGRTTFARTTRKHVDWSDGTCDAHGKPWRGFARCRTCDPRKNAYERRDPNLASHKTADDTCHHPLVKCSHKW